MSKDSHKVVGSWKRIAEYTPYKEQSLRKRFGKEMLALGVLFRNGMPGRKKKGPIIWGIVWCIEEYCRFKGTRGEFGHYQPNKDQFKKPLDKP